MDGSRKYRSHAQPFDFLTSCHVDMWATRWVALTNLSLKLGSFEGHSNYWFVAPSRQIWREHRYF